MVALMIPWKEKKCFNEKKESLLAAQRQNLVATCLVKADWLGFFFKKNFNILEIQLIYA